MVDLTVRESRFAGVLLGTALGDTLGLPFEGMSRRRVRKLLARRPLSHRFLFGRGMMSDDTEHACLVAQALLATRGDPPLFAQSLARGLRWWLLAAPAGIGWATLRGTVRLWLGYRPEQSGVWSAGNGPATRAPLLGVFAGGDELRLRALVRASTLLTHTDPRAFDGALAVALAASLAPRTARAGYDPRQLLLEISDRIDPGPIAELVKRASACVSAPVEAFADELGAARGVSGFVNHTVPVALLCWARNPRDARTAISEAIALGGDTDTTGAIVGALVGAGVGTAGLPRSWLTGLWEFPRSARWMQQVASRLARGDEPAPLAWPALLLRNAIFTAGIFALLARRALPPY